MRPYQPYTVKFARYLWRFKLTPPGKYLLYAIILSLPSTASVLIPAYQVFCMLTTLFVVAWILGFGFRPKLKVHCRMPERASVGQVVASTVRFTNLSWRSAYDIMIIVPGLPNSLKAVDADRSFNLLPPGASGELPFTIKPSQRGRFTIPALRAHSTFPFNLIRNGASSCEIGDLLVLPEFIPLSNVRLPMGVRFQSGGTSLTQNIGASPEYIGNRDYIPGEPARRLDFRSWARLAKPVVREYQEEHYCRVGLIMDTFVPRRHRFHQPDTADFEAVISLTAAIADRVSAGEYLIEVLCTGPDLYLMKSGQHEVHRDVILEALAVVQPSRKAPFGAVTPALTEQAGNLSAMVCVFLDWDDSRRRLCRQIAQTGCALKIIIVREADTTNPIGDFESEMLQVSPNAVMAGGIHEL